LKRKPQRLRLTHPDFGRIQQARTADLGAPRINDDQPRLVAQVLGMQRGPGFPQRFGRLLARARVKRGPGRTRGQENLVV